MTWRELNEETLTIVKEIDPPLGSASWYKPFDAVVILDSTIEARLIHRVVERIMKDIPHFTVDPNEHPPAELAVRGAATKSLSERERWDEEQEDLKCDGWWDDENNPKYEGCKLRWKGYEYEWPGGIEPEDEQEGVNGDEGDYGEL